MLGLTALFAIAAVAVWQPDFGAFRDAGALGIDYRTFVDDGHLLTVGSPFLAYQLSGPYEALPDAFRQPADVPFLYPPPFELVGVALVGLPSVIWWAVPILLLAWIVVGWRPAPWTWPIIAFAVAYPATSSIVIVGGSTMWVTTLVAGGLRFGWPATLILLKSSFAPLALVGVRHRSWWLALALLGGASLILWPLWSEYATALRNTTDLAPWYLVGDIPMLAIPVVAWLGRTRRGGTTRQRLNRRLPHPPSETPSIRAARR